MSYHRKNRSGLGTTLIAREGYSGMGDVTSNRAAASAYCGQKFGVSSADFAPCVNHYASGQPHDYVPASAPRDSASGSSSVIDKIGGFLSSLTKGAVNTYVAGKAQPPTVIQGGGGMPSWVVPVAIGGAGLVAVLMITRK